MTEQVRIALVGAGMMGSLHARVISQHRDASLVRVVDPDSTRGAPLAERWGSTWVPTLDSFEGIDAVVVATPTEHHAEWGTRCIAEAVPVLVEKPLTGSLEQTELLVSSAIAGSVPLMCGLLERYNPAVMAMHEIVERPLHLNVVRHSPYTPRIATGVMGDLAIHDIDLAVRLAGAEPVDVTAFTADFHPDSGTGSEDVAEVGLRFASGLMATISASRISQRKIRTLQVAELDRLVEVDLLRRDITVYHHVVADFMPGRDTGYRQQTVIDIPVITESREPLATQLDRFLALIAGEIDLTAEALSILPAHRVLDRAARVAAG